MFNKGECLFFVEKSGKVTPVVAMSDTSKNTGETRCMLPDANEREIHEFNLFRGTAAAAIASNDRKRLLNMH